MNVGTDGVQNLDEIDNALSLNTAIKEIFGDTKPEFKFREESGTIPATVLGLILEGTESDWKNYANMETKTKNRAINGLLNALYPYFNNPDYRGPEASELSIYQELLYNLVTTRLPQTTELIGVPAVIPNVRAQVQDGIANRGNHNPGAHIVIGVENYNSPTKK